MRMRTNSCQIAMKGRKIMRGFKVKKKHLRMEGIRKKELPR
jgi:hypothetical protein